MPANTAPGPLNDGSKLYRGGGDMSRLAHKMYGPPTYMPQDMGVFPVDKPVPR